MSRLFFGYVTVSSTFGNFGKLTRTTPSISTKSSATTSSSRCAPGLRIARNSSNFGSVPVLAPVVALADWLGTVADRLAGDNHRYPPSNVGVVQLGAEAHRQCGARLVRRARRRRNIVADDRGLPRRDEGRHLSPVQD